MLRLSAVLPVCLALTVGCSDEPTTPSIDVSRPECENLNPRSCMAPWPSSRYLREGRIEIPEAALLVNKEGEQVTPEPYERFDGFSLNGPLVTVVPTGVDPAPLVDETAVADSLLDTSPTVIVDAETGERVPHFAELDNWGGNPPDRVALYLRPIRPYEEARRYFVAIRALSMSDGNVLEPTAYFRALRDEQPTDVEELEARRDDFEEIFDGLEAAGIERESLIEAWDFRTGTRATYTRDLLQMVEDARSRIGEDGFGCTVTEVTEDFGHAELYRRIDGVMTVPLYVENEAPGSPLTRGPDDLPVFNRMGQAPFTFVIPYSVRDRIEAGSEPAALAIYGHGLLGDRTAIATDVSDTMIRGNGRFGPTFERNEMVAVGTDFWGLTFGDTESLGTALSNLDLFQYIPERLLQGVINFLTLEKSFGGGGACSGLPELEIAGESTIDPAVTHYVGVSGGAVTGATYAAFSDIERYGLVVGGASYALMISRSFAFFPFNLILNTWYDEKVDRDIQISMLAHLWDQFDPASYAPFVIREPLPGAPARQVLLMTVRDDALVPNIASDYAARTLGLPMMTPSPRSPYDVATIEDGAASAYTVFDLQAERQVPGAASPNDNGVHGSLMAEQTAAFQLEAFLQDGEVRSFCEGPCDPD